MFFTWLSEQMNLILILGICVAFLTAILTGGYEDKPGINQKKKRQNGQRGEDGGGEDIFADLQDDVAGHPGGVPLADIVEDPGGNAHEQDPQGHVSLCPVQWS